MSNVRRAYKCLDNILAKSSITEKTDPIECKDRWCDKNYIIS